MKPTAHNTPESWRQTDAALRRALQQRNEALPGLPAGFAERMKARMEAEQVTAASTTAGKAATTDSTTIVGTATTTAGKAQGVDATPRKHRQSRTVANGVPTSQSRRLWPWCAAVAAVAAAMVAVVFLWPDADRMEPEIAASGVGQTTTASGGGQTTTASGGGQRVAASGGGQRVAASVMGQPADLPLPNAGRPLQGRVPDTAGNPGVLATLAPPVTERRRLLRLDTPAAATSEAMTATSEAMTASSEAMTASSEAMTASSEAKTASSEAMTATMTASSEAKTASSEAMTASSEAKTASSEAMTASSEAKTASSEAMTATSEAMTASSEAKTASSETATRSPLSNRGCAVPPDSLNSNGMHPEGVPQQHAVRPTQKLVADRIPPQRLVADRIPDEHDKVFSHTTTHQPRGNSTETSPHTTTHQPRGNSTELSPHTTTHQSRANSTEHDSRLLALSLHATGLGGSMTSADSGLGNTSLAAPENTYTTSNYYFLAGNGFTFVNAASVKAASPQPSEPIPAINERHHDLPFSLGLTVNIPLSQRLSLETGTTFTVLRSTFDHGTAQDYRHMRQRITYIGIPLQAQYSLLQTRTLRLYALGGLQVDFPLRAEQTWQHITGGSAEAETTVNPSAPVQLSPIVGLGAQLNITRHLSVFCQPSFQWFVPTSDPDGGSGLETWRTEHELAFSLPLGLRLTF